MRLLIPLLALVIGACGKADDKGQNDGAQDGCEAAAAQRPVVKFYVYSPN